MSEQMIFKISFRGSFHTNKQRPELYIWDALHTNPDSHEGQGKVCTAGKLFLHSHHIATLKLAGSSFKEVRDEAEMRDNLQAEAFVGTKIA